MDFDVERAVEYILSGEIEREKQAQKNSSGAKGMFNSIKHYTRSKSPLKARKPSPATAAVPEIIDVSDDEDRQMQLAMEMSLQQNVPSRGPSPKPPSGSVSGGMGTPQFRPATGTDYHESNWGMVLSNQNQQETGVVNDQGDTWPVNTSNEPESMEPAADRKRVEGQPVVLDPRTPRNTSGADNVAQLSAVLTILHKIPKVREALLLASLRDGTEETPWDSWWNGGQSQSRGRLEESEKDPSISVLEETARIVAFLDETERAYGKLAPHLIAALQADNKDSEVSPANFLSRWTTVLQSNSNRTYHTTALPHLFCAEIIQPTTNNQPDLKADLTEISSGVSRELSDAGTYNIIDALEGTIWWESTPAYIKQFSDVLLIRLKREDHEGGAGVEILPKLPLGRFAFEFYDQAVEKIRERNGIWDILQKLRKREIELSSIQKSGTKYQAQEILEATLQYLGEIEGRKFIDHDAEDDDDSSRMDLDTEKVFPRISGLLQTSIQSLNEELERIRTNRCNMEERLRTMMDFPTSITRQTPVEGASTSISTTISLVYDLRGVVVDNNLFYFSQWEHITNPYKRKLRWYKADFSGIPDITSVDEGDVLSVARDRGSQGVLTIYIRDDVPENVEKVLPPDYLREFIQKDNEKFQKELNPPVIHVSESNEDEKEMITEEATSSSVTPPDVSARETKSLNPFLNLDKLEDGSQKELMAMDPVQRTTETNPFRRMHPESEKQEAMEGGLL